jgi:hypothetical protein
MSKINGSTKLIIHSDFAARSGEDPTFKTTLGEAGINVVPGTEVAIRDNEVVDLLEDIFRAFNRVTEEDYHRLKALGYDLPSLSVNDSVIVGDRIFHVERVGFVETTVAKVEVG